MKLTNFFYNAVTQYLFLISFWSLIKTTKSVFTYTESKFGIGSPQKPFVTDIKIYEDNTILVRVIRFDSIQTNNDCLTLNGSSLEQTLRIRVIRSNGKTIEINRDLNIHPINYCLFNDIGNTSKVNPNKIYPLRNSFILITYMTTTNVSDISAYEEWGIVIDWNDTIRSNTSFGTTLVIDGLSTSKIQLNTDDNLGFLRSTLAVDGNSDVFLKWQQYSV
ncbi:hypothetical protein C2G38_1416018 [Gigaspora rosea]|uniref:Uncharacterized protein n=1 Tax=Gigaspora rosea TaxID=44941 RepID=A0A397VE72_9GLOM|nr:hypothetical protein C2G38_1416018 [Gigaspora rosea]